MIKAEKEEVLPDSTEDVTEGVKQDSSEALNILASNKEIKKEDETDTLSKTEEKTGKFCLSGIKPHWVRQLW